MQSRIERYSKIRRWLDNPFEQKPSPDKILSQMLVDEQSLMLKLANTGQAWTANSLKLRARPGKAEYRIEPFSGQLGKVYFVVRQNSNPEMPAVPIQFDDFNSQDYGKMPPVNKHLPHNIERISFYRKGQQSQDVKAVIQPVPSESYIYQIHFLNASFDRYEAALSESQIADELADYTDLNSAIALLPYSFWRKDTEKDNIEYNLQRRKELGTGLLFQLNKLDPVVEQYIKQINLPTSFEMDYWND